MSKLLLLGAVILLLDVFPGGGCSCSPTTSTLGGPCQTSCDCKATTAPIKCPGQWACNGKLTCEYSCSELCTADGGCASADKTCVGDICKPALQCP